MFWGLLVEGVSLTRIEGCEIERDSQKVSLSHRSSVRMRGLIYLNMRFQVHLNGRNVWKCRIWYSIQTCWTLLTSSLITQFKRWQPCGNICSWNAFWFRVTIGRVVDEIAQFCQREGGGCLEGVVSRISGVWNDGVDKNCLKHSYEFGSNRLISSNQLGNEPYRVTSHDLQGPAAGVVRIVGFLHVEEKGQPN